MSMEGLLLSLSAEYLVASDLTKQGYAVSVAASGLSYDLIIDLGTQLLKVQVKSTSGLRKAITGQVSEYYVFKVFKEAKATHYTRDSFDIIALVAMDIGLIGYLPTGQVLGLKSIQLKGPDQTPSKSVQGIHELPFNKALEQALKAKNFSLDEELTKAFGAKP